MSVLVLMLFARGHQKNLRGQPFIPRQTFSLEIHCRYIFEELSPVRDASVCFL